MRYTAQRYGTWEWLDLDVDLITDGPEWALSSWGVMTATISPEQAALVAADGRPVFEEWGTLVYAETDDDTERRRWGGIVARTETKGAQHELRIVEFPGYADGVPVDVLVRGTGTDPVVLIREVWQAVQAHPTGWLNIDVIGETPVRLGTDLDDRVAAARALMDIRKAQLDGFSEAKAEKTAELMDTSVTLADDVAAAREAVAAAQATLNGLYESDAPQEQIDDALTLLAGRRNTLATLEAAYAVETAAARAALATAAGDVDFARALHEESRVSYQAAVDRAREEGGAYEVRAEDLTDAAKAIADIVRASGVEWTTGIEYSDTVPQFYIRVHYPHAGTRRDDLVFEQGVNIVSELDPVRDGSDYANAGYGIGAGEGSSAVRATVEQPSDRLRRPVVVEDRSLQRVDQVSAKVRAEIARLDGAPYVSQITVIDHELAPIGAWAVGDIITITGSVPHLGEYAKAHRIISWKYQGETRAELRLAPAH